jgi:hypothetical protein
MTSGWLETVAAKVGKQPTEVELALRRRGVMADRPLRPARNLTVQRIAFKGEKRGKATGLIDFDWSNLATGIWAVTSHKNFAGKSSVLEILLWCLRGTPKNLQDDIRGWLSWVCVEFTVDNLTYIVEFDVDDKVPGGTLSRRMPDGDLKELDHFKSDDGFAAAMSGFMMDSLDLDPLPSIQVKDGEGKLVEHGWNALSGALYFGGDHKQLLGDVQMSGLPARMLQMYIGLPWALTLMQARTAKRELTQEGEKAGRVAAQAAVESAKARSRIEGELERARKTLEGLGPIAGTAQELERLAGEVARLSPNAAEAIGRAARARAEAQKLTEMAIADERAARDLRENIVATRFFNGLRPVCCPRCETQVPAERIKRESVDLNCSLCAEDIAVEDMDGTSETIDEAERRVEASKAAADRANANAETLERQAATNARALSDAREALAKAAASATFEDRRRAELDVARLEGALKERAPSTASPAVSPDLPLIHAAGVEAAKAYEVSRGDILDRLNAEILDLGQRLGVELLESVALNTNGSLKITKGAQGTNFSAVTPGERLRLRLATAISLLRVGHERGLGRHPGLLIIDSPGNEEVSDIDLSALLGELQLIARETPGLQIIVASANAPKIVAQLGEDYCKVAAEGENLW